MAKTTKRLEVTLTGTKFIIHGENNIDDRYFSCEIEQYEYNGIKSIHCDYVCLEALFDYMSDERYKVVRLNGKELEEILGRKPFRL